MDSALISINSTFIFKQVEGTPAINKEWWVTFTEPKCSGTYGDLIYYFNLRDLLLPNNESNHGIVDLVELIIPPSWKFFYSFKSWVWSSGFNTSILQAENIILFLFYKASLLTFILSLELVINHPHHSSYIFLSNASIAPSKSHLVL